MGNKLEMIGYGSFSNCKSLVSITIPDSVISIEGFAFRDCVGLKSIQFAENSKLLRIENHAFTGCTGLTSVTIPEGVIKIENYAFAGCTGLTSVTIPDSVKQFNLDYVFDGCQLENIHWKGNRFKK